jgi:hypothetical protein
VEGDERTRLPYIIPHSFENDSSVSDHSKPSHKSVRAFSIHDALGGEAERVETLMITAISFRR